MKEKNKIENWTLETLNNILFIKSIEFSSNLKNYIEKSSPHIEELKSTTNYNFLQRSSLASQFSYIYKVNQSLLFNTFNSEEESRKKEFKKEYEQTNAVSRAAYEIAKNDFIQAFLIDEKFREYADVKKNNDDALEEFVDVNFTNFNDLSHLTTGDFVKRIETNISQSQELSFRSAYETIKNKFDEANDSLDYLLKERRATIITRASEIRKFDFLALYMGLIKETSGLYLDKKNKVPVNENRMYYDLIFEFNVKLTLKLKEAYANNDVFRQKMDAASKYSPLLKKVF